jgi:hypothetical protein
MNNDKAQELTTKITESINALCAETDAAKQSAIYRAWLSTLSRFHKYSYWGGYRPTTPGGIASSFGLRPRKLRALQDSTLGNR